MATLNVGDVRELVLTENLTRTQIVQYAGASSDFNPLHSDERFAKEIAGFPGVFAHGMLTMGMTGRVLTDWFGPESLLRYGVRFVGQVWPGDHLTVTATVTAVEPDEATLDVVTTNGNGDTVLRGSATVRRT